MKKRYFLNALFWVSFYFLLLAGCTSCATQRKADKYIAKHPEYAARICDSLFPIVTYNDTVYTVDQDLLDQYEANINELGRVVDSLLNLKGYKVDSLTLDSIISGIKSTVKPVVKTITVTKESTAKLELQRIEFDKKFKAEEKRHKGLVDELNQRIDWYANQDAEKEKKIEEQSEKIDILRKMRNTYMWLFLLLLAYTFRKPISKLLYKILSPIKI